LKLLKSLKLLFFLKRNSNFFRQFGFGIKFRFTNSAKESFGKSKGKVTLLALNNDFKRAGSFKKLHYIDTSDIYKL